MNWKDGFIVDMGPLGKGREWSQASHCVLKPDSSASKALVPPFSTFLLKTTPSLTSAEDPVMVRSGTF